MDFFACIFGLFFSPGFSLMLFIVLINPLHELRLSRKRSSEFILVEGSNTSSSPSLPDFFLNERLIDSESARGCFTFTANTSSEIELEALSSCLATVKHRNYIKQEYPYVKLLKEGHFERVHLKVHLKGTHICCRVVLQKRKGSYHHI